MTSKSPDYIAREQEADRLRAEFIEAFAVREIKWSRRNLTPDQASYLRGMQYNAEKKAQGGTGANQHQQRDQSDLSAKTAQRIASEHKVSEPTIKRDGKYATAVDAAARRTARGGGATFLSGATKVTN